MLISEKIQEYLPEIKMEIINEQSVKTIGFFDCKEESIACFVGAKKFIKNVPDNARTLLVPKSLADSIDTTQRGIIIVDNPQEVFWTLHQKMQCDNEYVREDCKNIISDSALIGENVSIAKKNVIIEEGVIIEDFVTIKEYTHIKKNSIIRSGCRIGGVGFQEYNSGTTIDTINHYGGVVIGEHVDIQYNSCIDKALFPWEDTEIGDETKLDNMVHIAHATKIGKRCELAANAIIAGRCIIGNDVWIGLAAIVRNFVKVGNNCRLNIGSVVVDDVPDGASVSGNYAIDHNAFMYEQIQRRRIK